MSADEGLIVFYFYINQGFILTIQKQLEID